MSVSSDQLGMRGDSFTRGDVFVRAARPNVDQLLLCVESEAWNWTAVGFSRALSCFQNRSVLVLGVEYVTLFLHHRPWKGSRQRGESQGRKNTSHCEHLELQTV